MAVPDHSVVNRAVVDALVVARPEGASILEERGAVEARLLLSEDDLSEPTAGGSTTKVGSRVSWAVTYLFQAGVLDRVSRGRYRLNGEGRRLARTGPVTISCDYLRAQYPRFAAWSQRGAAKKNGGEPTIRDVLARLDEIAAKLDDLCRQGRLI